MWYSLVLAVLAGYFLGNLNGAVTMSLLHGREDIRAKGSGNAGLTNYFRNYGGLDTLFVFAIDVGKTLLACLLAGRLMAPYGLWRQGVMMGGLAVILGHNFPALLGFRGGKGIVCSAFLMLVADWRIFLIIVAVFVLVYAGSKYVSLASCTAAAALIACSWGFYWRDLWMALAGTLVGLLALYMHRENIARLAKGTERKTYLRKDKK